MALSPSDVMPPSTLAHAIVREIMKDMADMAKLAPGGDPPEVDGYLADSCHSFQSTSHEEGAAYAANLEWMVVRLMNMTAYERTHDYWDSHAEKTFLDRTIIRAEYMSDQVRDVHGWNSCPLVLWLDDGNTVYASCDDEGNDAGALFTLTECGRGSDCFPVI